MDLKKKTKKDQTSNTQKLKKLEQQSSEREKEIEVIIKLKDSHELELKKVRQENGRLAKDYSSL